MPEFQEVDVVTSKSNCLLLCLFSLVMNCKLMSESAFCHYMFKK